MDRVIKFRGKSTSVLGEIKKGCWVYGSLVTGTLGNTISSHDGKGCVFVDERTIGQFTGLTDRNNVEIYEGDIVSLDYGHRKEVVKYHTSGGQCGFYPFLSSEHHWQSIYSEIIGNIYEHPHLLEGVK